MRPTFVTFFGLDFSFGVWEIINLSSEFSVGFSYQLYFSASATLSANSLASS